MKNTILLSSVGIIVAGIILYILVSPFDTIASGTIIVTGNTSSGENQTGWLFNRDENSAASYVFSPESASFGLGSIYAGPISSSDASEKFTAEYFPPTLPVSSLDSFSYDVKIGAGGTLSDANHFYLNLYVNIDDSDNFYDCRFDYIQSAGTQVSFSKTVIFPSVAPTNVQKGSDRIVECPPILSMMPVGSHIRAFALNMGDTTLSDAGLDGYFDNVEIVVDNDATTFNFEPIPQVKSDCQNGSWEKYGYKNQGRCTKFLGGQDR